MLQSMWSRRVRHDLVTEQQQNINYVYSAAPPGTNFSKQIEFQPRGREREELEFKLL